MWIREIIFIKETIRQQSKKLDKTFTQKNNAK